MSPIVASRRNYLREITNMYIRESFERTSKENNCKRVWIFAIRNGHCKCCSSFIHFFCPNSEHLSNLLSQSDRCRRNLIDCTNFDSIRNGTIQRFRFTYRLPLQRYCYLQATFIPISCFVAWYFWSILPAHFRGTRDNVSGYIPGRYQPVCPWQRLFVRLFQNGDKAR